MIRFKEKIKSVHFGPTNDRTTLFQAKQEKKKKKGSVMLFCVYLTLTSCKISEKSYQSILRKWR